MKKPFLLLCLLALGFTPAGAQEMTLSKGYVMDSLPLADSVGSRLSLYLPSNFEPAGKWPLLFMVETDGDTYQSMRYMKNAAERNGYVLATSKALSDSLSLTQKVLYFGKSLEVLTSMLPLDLNRIYVSGYGNGGELATLLPSLIPRVRGVLLLGSGLPNWELVRPRSRFHFVGVIGRSDFRYLNMLDGEELLDNRKVPNHVLYFEGGERRPEDALVDRGVNVLTLMGMAGGHVAKDTALIERSRASFTAYVRQLWQAGSFLLAYDQLEEAIALLDPLTDTRELKAMERDLRREAGFKAQKRDAGAFQLRERILRDDFSYYLEEDVLSFNLDNLGWWRYQMEQIGKYKESPRMEEKLMGMRLESYVNALVDEYIRIARTAENPDEDGQILLRMVKTITSPTTFANYLEIISLTAKYDDFGTALFYLEELLKQGYADREALYALPHTALLRITPEYNTLISQYLKEARYEVPEPQDGDPDQGFNR